MQRLRRIQQLGFGAQGFPAADHSRFAHALGTMHVMSRLTHKVLVSGDNGGRQVANVKKLFPNAFCAASKEGQRKELADHLALVGLIQDTGELPFPEATESFYRPSDTLRKDMEAAFAMSVEGLTNKQIFTLAVLDSEPIRRAIGGGMSIDLIVTLLTKRMESTSKPAASLRPLFHMVDGSIDADRMDYVFRDAYHTIGFSGTAATLIDSLLYFDDEGPVVSTPAEATSLFTTRAHLNYNVYNSAVKRFRARLLLSLLRGISSEPALQQLLPGSTDGTLSFQQFLQLDDSALLSAIADLNTRHDVKNLDADTRASLRLLADDYEEYTDEWVLATPAQIPKDFKFVKPTGLFYDFLHDQVRRTIYRRKSVRVKSYAFRNIGDLVPLEECSGPFSQLLSSGVPLVPVRDSVMVFTPTRRSGKPWQAYERARNEGWLYRCLQELDSEARFNAPADTRALPGYSGPAIFVSFSWLDIGVVKRVVEQLNALKRRYFLLLDPYEGVGETTRVNSEQAVKDAEAVLIIASKAYGDRFQLIPQGNIAAEFFEMSRRWVAVEPRPIMVLGVDEYTSFKETLPWNQLGFDDVPYTGPALRESSDDDLRSALVAGLRRLDKFK
jgi:HD superfamily phosphohydrolase